VIGGIFVVGISSLVLLDKNFLSSIVSLDANHQTQTISGNQGTPVIDPETNQVLKTTDVLEN